MRNIILSLLIIYIVVAFGWLISAQSDTIRFSTNPQSVAAAPTIAQITPETEVPVAVTTSLTAAKAQAMQLRIPKLSIDAYVQEVGLAENGNMGIPTNYQDAGWFNQGPRPGEKGNAIMAGHLDTKWFSPGVFRRLKELEPGDDIYVDLENGEALHFKVVKSENYFFDNAPLEEIFGPTSAQRLNLITCDGTWNQAVKRYNKRLVVFTELVP